VPWYHAVLDAGPCLTASTTCYNEKASRVGTWLINTLPAASGRCGGLGVSPSRHRRRIVPKEKLQVVFRAPHRESSFCVPDFGSSFPDFCFFPRGIKGQRDYWRARGSASIIPKGYMWSCPGRDARLCLGLTTTYQETVTRVSKEP